MMLANHTSIRGTFETLRQQFKSMKNRNVNVHHFKETRLFQDSLEEFDNAEEVVRSLVDEYAAAEKADYIEWGQEEQNNQMNQ